MFTIAYSKRTKKIVFWRNDESTELKPFDYYFNLNFKGQDLNQFVVMEYPYDESLQIVLGNHVYNPVTGLIEEDPSYVPPAPVLTPPPTE